MASYSYHIFLFQVPSKRNYYSFDANNSCASSISLPQILSAWWRNAN